MLRSEKSIKGNPRTERRSILLYLSITIIKTPITNMNIDSLKSSFLSFSTYSPL